MRIFQHGDTPLYWAARHGHCDAIHFLCKNGCSVNHKNKCNETALHVAVRYGHLEVVRLLCELGADPDFQDEVGIRSVKRLFLDTQRTVLWATTVERFEWPEIYQNVLILDVFTRESTRYVSRCL